MTVRNIVRVSLLQIEYPGSRGQPAAPYPLIQSVLSWAASLYASNSRASVPPSSPNWSEQTAKYRDRWQLQTAKPAGRHWRRRYHLVVATHRFDVGYSGCQSKSLGFREARKNRGKDISKGARIPLRCNMLQCPCKTVAGYGTR